MKYIDLSILSREPAMNKKVKFIVEPLAPLSMVTSLPGSYFRTQKIPSKKMICGLMENILEWRFSIAIRTEILNTITRNGNPLTNYKEGSTYIPLLMDFFEIEGIPELSFESICFYDDLWSRHHSRKKDSPMGHAEKCRNVSPSLIEEWKEKLKDQTSEKIKKINDDYKHRIPNFYPVLPTKREYVSFNKGRYEFKMKIDENLYSMLDDRLKVYNIGYLGNNEGWVNIEMKEYD